MAGRQPASTSPASTSAGSARRAGGGRASSDGARTTTTSRRGSSRPEPPRARRSSLYGHSLGGLLVLGYAVAEEPGRCLTPWCSARPRSTQRPGLEAVDRPGPGPGGAHDEPEQRRSTAAILSRDPAVGERYLADPLNEHRTTIRSAPRRLRRSGAGPCRRRPTGDPDARLPRRGGPARAPRRQEPLASVPAVTRRTYPRLRHESTTSPRAGGHRRHRRLASRDRGRSGAGRDPRTTEDRLRGARTR